MKYGEKHSIIVIDHEDGETVYCWDVKSGLEVVAACLHEHPKQEIAVRTIRMTEKQFERLPVYDGDCQ